MLSDIIRAFDIVPRREMPFLHWFIHFSEIIFVEMMVGILEEDIFFIKP